MMNSRSSFLLLLFSLATGAVFAGNRSLSDQAKQRLNEQPVRFTENKGQLTDTDGKPVPHVLFNAKAPGLDLYITHQGLSYVFFQIGKEPQAGDRTPGAVDRKLNNQWARIDMALKGAAIRKENIVREGESRDVSHYYLGHCPEGIRDVRSYEKITIRSVYPGIDWVLYNSSEQGFKYDFIVHPGADANQVELVYSSLGEVKVGADGGLFAETGLGTLHENAPVSFQDGKEVNTKFERTMIKKNSNDGCDSHFRFSLDEYDKSKKLVIDPQLVWGTFVGGNNLDGFKAVDCDANGNMYVTGYVYSNNWPTQAWGGAYFQGAFGGAASDAFILRFDPAGVLTWSIYYGGNSNDQGNALAIDAGGNVYVAGTAGGTFPTQPWGGAYFDGTPGAGFILRFSPTGTRDWATFYDQASAYGIALDGGGNIYVTGTATAGMPTLAWGTAYQNNVMQGVVDAFVLRFTNTGVRTWATYYGGNNLDWPYTIDTDAGGNIYLAGYTQSNNLTTQAWGSYLDNTLDGANDAFIVRFNNTGGLSFASYYGGTGGDYISSLATDPNGHIYAIGETGSANLTTQAWGLAYFDNTMSGANDAFVLRFSNAGTLDWCTFYGGSAQETQSNTYDNICTDNCGNVYVVFNTPSNDIQTFNPGCGAYYDGTFGGGNDIVLIKFNGAGQRLWATFVGDVQPDGRHCIAVDNNYNVVLGGEWMNYVSLGALPVMNPGGGAYFDNSPNGMDDSFIMKFVPPFTVTPSSTSAGCTCTGTATASATCGTAPYTYSWSNGQTTANITGLCAGVFTVTVSDSMCLVKSATVQVTGSAPITASATGLPANCGQSNGSASLTTSGGTGAYTYSWNPSGQTTATATGLSGGTYTVTVTDNNGCTQTATATVSSSGAGTASITGSTNVSCFGGSNGTAGSTISGGTSPYTYSWSNGGTQSAISNLQSGIYTVSITDASGCTVTQTVSITQPSAISHQTSSTNASCNPGNDGTASVSSSGGTGTHSYSWSNGSTQSAISNLQSGIYTVTVTDGNGCTATATATVGSNSGPSATATAAATTIVQGASTTLNATGGGTYTWSPSAGLSCTNCQSPTATPAATTQYCVTVTDTNGCTATACVTVEVKFDCPGNDGLVVPSAFSPNGDGHNDVIKLHGWKNCVTTFIFTVYDRWGEKVFQSEDPEAVWDGTYRGRQLDPAVFAYYISATNNNNEPFIKKGNISLLK